MAELKEAIEAMSKEQLEAIAKLGGWLQEAMKKYCTCECWKDCKLFEELTSGMELVVGKLGK